MILIVLECQFKFYDEFVDRAGLSFSRRQFFPPALTRDHSDPFFSECRAYGRLIEKNINGKVAVQCYGYLMIAADREDELKERFWVTTWNRPDEEDSKPASKREPFRAVVKDLVTEDVPLTAKTAKKMLLDLRKMRESQVYNLNIQARNYRGGRLVDFSEAITTP